MKRTILTIFILLILIAFQGCVPNHPAQPQPSIHFDFASAEAMMKVIQALHDHPGAAAIEKLLDEALDFEAYQVSHDRYNDPSRSEENRITLSQFRSFMLSFSEDKLDTQDNRRLNITKPFYEEAVANPDKFYKAVGLIQSVPSARFQEAFDTALHWLPGEPELDIHVWILFDIGGSGAWAFRGTDGRQHVGFNLLHMLDENGEFDIDLFLGILAHEIHHIGFPLSEYFKSIDYDGLKENSRLKLYSDYMVPLVTEGAAQKFCNNAPGALSGKPYPERAFAATQSNLDEWAYYQTELTDIHKRAVRDLRQLLGEAAVNMEKFREDYDNYWTWKAGEVEDREIMLGRQYYYGAELLGVINAALGRKAVLAGILDFRKIPALYNEGIQKLRPEDFKAYLFPDDIIKIMQEL